ncbi:hypothetical protein LIER_37709 [Lithospermum erythrorhizon]|uniref:Transposon Ty3-I Gag-Pol polyprotein n=1 Tax=Lithospermum erythrorhizon TaxID=34254 RepID=A0AAV3PQW4_LITER
MSGVDANISIYTLHVDPSHRHIKQKKRNLFEEKNQTIQEEIDELIKVVAIRELQFPKWIVNVVMVKKSNGKWRMCMNFTNLNKAYPKDYFPLPCLGRLVDGSAGYKVFDFLDASRGQKHGDLCKCHVGEKHEAGGARGNSQKIEGESATHQSGKMFIKSNVWEILRVHDK